MDSDCETEFLYPDLPEPATIQPYMFEPVPQSQHSEDAAAGGPSSSDQEESEDEDINIDRIGHKEWCQCGHCFPMNTGRESLCCKEVDRVRERATNFACITDHGGFAALCLNHHVVEAAIYQYVHEEEGGYVDDRPTFELFRYVAYRQFVRWIWRKLGIHVRTVIPSCAVLKIRAQFPSETYTGFKLPGIDH